MLLGHGDERRQVDQDLQGGPGQDRDLLVARHRPVPDPELSGTGVEAEELPDLAEVGLDGRVHLLAERHQAGFVALEPAHAHPDSAGELDPAHPLEERVVGDRGAVVETVADPGARPEDAPGRQAHQGQDEERGVQPHDRLTAW